MIKYEVKFFLVCGDGGWWGWGLWDPIKFNNVLFDLFLYNVCIPTVYVIRYIGVEFINKE